MKAPFLDCGVEWGVEEGGELGDLGWEARCPTRFRVLAEWEIIPPQLKYHRPIISISSGGTNEGAGRL